MLERCIHKSIDACKRQGGPGSLLHLKGYVHPIPTLSEMGKPVEKLEILEKSNRTCTISGLEDEFDDDTSLQFLNTHISSIVTSESIAKSFYEFDVQSPEGVDRLLELLPILDPEILNAVYEEIFPNYPTDQLSTRVLRIELRGYLMDYLESIDERTTDIAGDVPADIEEAHATDETEDAESGLETDRNQAVDQQGVSS